MHRLKCPASRKEECSEECTAGKSINQTFRSNIFVAYFSIGNTEEEMEEHEEITHDEHRSSLNKSPKQKYETNPPAKKRSSKSKQSNTKIDL